MLFRSEAVLQHALARHQYTHAALVGFSLGGNLTLKYTGEAAAHLPAELRAAAGISVPCDLSASSERMAQPDNAFYLRRFLRDLQSKIRAKAAQFPDRISDAGFDSIRTFREFDDRYTAPIHGFRDAGDYYARSSSLRYLDAIRIPTLILNARDDPFLTPACFPERLALNHPHVHLEQPAHGGHVGFVQFRKEGEY